jgi:hypothetical protein
MKTTIRAIEIVVHKGTKANSNEGRKQPVSV